MVHFEGEHFTGLARWLTVPNSTITLWMCPKSQIDGQNHKNTGIRRKIFHKRPSRRADLGTLRMDDHWPVRNVFYERLRCWHLAWDSKLLSWQFDNTSTFWNKKKSYRLFLWLISSKKYEKKFQCRNRHPPKSSNSFQETCRGPIPVWDKKGMYKFSQKCTKRPKNCTKFGCALIVLSATKVCVFCNFWDTIAQLWFFYWNLEELQDPWWRIWSLNDSAIFGIHNTSQKKGRKFFCLPLPPIFNLRWLECLEIPTIVTKEGYYVFSLLYPPIFTSDDLNVWNSSNNSAELACFEPISLVFCSWTQKFYWGVSLKVWKRKNTL